MRILIITNTTPYPQISGGRIRVYNFIKRLSENHEIWLATHLHNTDELNSLEHLKKYCQGIESGLLGRKTPIEHLPGLLKYVLAGWPPELKFTYSKELEDKIRQLTSQIDFDIVQIDESIMALYYQALPSNLGRKTILTFYDIGWEQTARIAQINQNSVNRLRALISSKMMYRWEPRYAAHFDQCITVSEKDRQILLTANPSLKIEVVPNGVDTRLLTPLPRRSDKTTLLFVGTMNYEPCIDAMVFFCKEVLPQLRKLLPDIELLIVGANPSAEVLALQKDDVIVTGRVDSVLPYYEKSVISIVPLRAGGGTRLKVLEAMALGRPVVSTTIGSEGIEAVDRKDLLIANEAKQFVDKIFSLVNDKGLYDKISSNARELVVEKYDWDILTKKLEQVYGTPK